MERALWPMNQPRQPLWPSYVAEIAAAATACARISAVCDNNQTALGSTVSVAPLRRSERLSCDELRSGRRRTKAAWTATIVGARRCDNTRAALS